MPTAAVSTWPSRASPLITGGEDTAGSGPFDATTPVAAEVALFEPNGLRARTSTRIECPTSSVPSWRVWPVDVPLQPPPPVSQRRHWYVNVIGPAPLHVPDVAVTVSPCLTVPTIVGADVLTGAPSLTTALGPETAFADPSELEAVTETRSVCPASLLLGLYVCAVAPPMFEHLSPPELQRCQR